mgnify:CR=1 FL=1
MSTLLVMKEQLQVLYAKYSTYITIGMRLILGLLVFGLINSNIGFMKVRLGLQQFVLFCRRSLWFWRQLH